MGDETMAMVSPLFAPLPTPWRAPLTSMGLNTTRGADQGGGACIPGVLRCGECPLRCDRLVLRGRGPQSPARPTLWPQHTNVLQGRCPSFPAHPQALQGGESKEGLALADL